jgi:hypothetical protein
LTLAEGDLAEGDLAEGDLAGAERWDAAHLYRAFTERKNHSPAKIRNKSFFSSDLERVDQG